MIYDFDKTLQETTKIRKKYPERVPIYVKKAAGCEFIDIDKKRWITRYDTLSRGLSPRCGKMAFCVRSAVGMVQVQI